MAVRTKEQLKQIFVEQAVLTQDDFYDLIDSMVSVMDVPDTPDKIVYIYQGAEPPNGWRKPDAGYLPELTGDEFIYIIKDAVS